MNREMSSELAFLPIEEIREVQEQKLQQHIRYCLENSPFYKRRFPGLLLEENVTLQTLQSLEFTCKEDIEEFNDDFLATDYEHIVDIVTSSGTTGKATKIMYTDADLKRLAYNEKKAFECCGLMSSDTVLLTCTLDRCFVAGLAYFLGIKEVGAAVIRNGHGTLLSHNEALRIHKPTVIVGVPTFLKKLGQYMRSLDNPPELSSVTKLVCIGESVRKPDMSPHQICSDLETLWGAKVFSTYASTEIVTTFCECETQSGGHLQPDLAIVEIVDESGKSLPAGEVGEVVVTPLGVTGMPLIRFKTGDISFIIDEYCQCGRNSERLGPIIGRKKQMLKVKGTTVYPQAIFSAVMNIKGVLEYCIEVSCDDNLMDHVTVFVSIDGDHHTKNMISEQLQSKIRFKPSIVFETESNLRKRIYLADFRKPIRFFDLRNPQGKIK